MNSPPASAPSRCHQCGATELEIAPGFTKVGRVTSDCKPWPPGGILAWCRACGLLQTVTDANWQAEVARIYNEYTIYHQSGGKEQPVFNPATGAGRSRSDTIVEALQRAHPLPARGRLLDVGCGNGAFLRACSRVLSGWTLYGSEVSDKYKQVVEGIPGVDRLYTEPLAQIPGSFDLISLIHVIEHIPGPGTYLKALAGKLNPGGLLFLEAPDASENFFTMLVADHCSHLSPPMLGRIAAAAGFEVLDATNAWVPKEVSVLARRSAAASPPPPPPPASEAAMAFAGWRALQAIIAQVEPLTRQQPFGIFGTSIAATWLQAQIGDAARFFVDEDKDRIGKQHLGQPIVDVAHIPDEATVYVALPPALAAGIAARLRAAKPRARIVAP